MAIRVEKDPNGKIVLTEMADPNPLFHREKLITPGRFWIGGDVRAAENTVLFPTSPKHREQWINACFNESSLPFFGEEEVSSFLKIEDGIHTRSRAAQLGLLTLPYSSTSDGIKPYPPIVKRNGLYYTKLPVAVLGPRAIVLKKGEGFACYYDKSEAQELTGQELIKSIGEDRGVVMKGKYRKDWFFVNDHFQPLAQSDPSAVALALSLSDQRLCVSKGEPVAIFGDEIKDYRLFLEKNGILQPVKTNEFPQFWIGETKYPIEIKEDYNGLLNVAQIGGGFVAQTLSFLIKGGKTSWPIRLELFMPKGKYVTDYEENDLEVKIDKNTNMYIFMEVYRNGDIK